LNFLNKMLVTQYCPHQPDCELRAKSEIKRDYELYPIETENRCYCNVLERLNFPGDKCSIVQDKDEYLERHPLPKPDIERKLEEIAEDGLSNQIFYKPIVSN